MAAGLLTNFLLALSPEYIATENKLHLPPYWRLIKLAKFTSLYPIGHLAINNVQTRESKPISNLNPISEPFRLRIP